MPQVHGRTARLRRHGERCPGPRPGEGGLGDEKLNYPGYSYGTFLGATYADLYPAKTGRLVLDGAVDPATSDFEVTETQAVGFENAARAYLAECLGESDCPFTGTVDSSMYRIRAILDRLDASPFARSDGRMLGSSAMFTAIILPLYSESNWPYLSDLFTDVLSGNADYAFQLADAYYGRDADGTYLDNSTEAFVAINCLDYSQRARREYFARRGRRVGEICTNVWAANVVRRNILR